MILKNVLESKPLGAITVLPDLKVGGVISVLAEKGIGAVVVVNNEDKLVGILSERDIVRSLSQRAASVFEATAADLMTRNPMSATSGTSVGEAMAMMTNGHFRHLPVVESGRLLGVVSIGDVVKAQLDQHQHEMGRMRTYVAGGI
jgi:CBS domain-containing protein